METLAISINDSAQALSLGRTTIYAMIADGRLQAFKLGRRRLVKAESIRRLIEEQAKPEASAWPRVESIRV